MEAMLAKMPVSVIIEANTALIGASGIVMDMSAADEIESFHVLSDARTSDIYISYVVESSFGGGVTDEYIVNVVLSSLLCLC